MTYNHAIHAKQTAFQALRRVTPLNHLRWRRAQDIPTKRAAAGSNGAPDSNPTTTADPTATATVTPATAVAAERSAAKQGSSSSSSSIGAGFDLLSTPERQSTAFLCLSVTSALFGAAALIAPELLLSVALGVPATPLDAAFTRIAGATMAISAAAEFSLKDAVIAGHLKSVTYQRLMLGIIAKSSLYLLAFLLSPDLWNPVLASFYPTAAAASILVNVSALRSACRQSGISSMQGLLAAAASGIGLPQSPASWIYSLFMLLYAATVAACYGPEVIFTGQPITPAGQLLKHTWAAGFLLAGVSCFVLKDAADRDRLGASTFRRLNLGLAATEAGYSLVFGWSIYSQLATNDSSSWSNLIGSILIAKYCSLQYFSSSSK